MSNENTSPDNLFILCSAYKLNNNLLFRLCRTCAGTGLIHCKLCNHTVKQHAWIDVYTSINIKCTLSIGYRVLEYREIWHYHRGSQLLFKDFILNIVSRKMECSDFPHSCMDRDDKVTYAADVQRNCSIKLEVANVRKDPAGRTLNKGMANSLWGKWAQNPGGQSGFKTRTTLKEYHDALTMGLVKGVSLVLDSVLQVESDNDR